jgi:hypothetical protein
MILIKKKEKMYFFFFQIFMIFATYFSLLWKTANFRPSESLRGENYIL